MAELGTRDPLGAFCPGPRVAVEGSLRGPLAGLRFAAKDNFAVAGFVSGGGNPDWARTHGPASSHAEAVRRILAAGASLVGKTVMDELAFGALGRNDHYGMPRNPAAPDRMPGGSSSGSASAVAGGLADFALGTDSACSVRLPASLCGIYGMRPTHGRIPLEGVIPLSPSLDTVGWLACSADLMGRVAAVLLDPATRADRRPTRLLMAEDAFALARPEVGAALEPTVRRLARLFGGIERGCLGAAGQRHALGLLLLRSQSVQVREAWQCFGAWIDRVRPRSRILNRQELIFGAESTPEQLGDARRSWAEARAWLRAKVPPGTLLCLPTTCDVAPRRDAGEVSQSFTIPSLALLAPAVVGGLPQLSIPGATVDGLPVGISIVGAPGADEELLRVASELGATPS